MAFTIPIASRQILRGLSRLCPFSGYFEKKFCDGMHRLVRVPKIETSFVAGNGFRMTGDTNNIGYITGLSERGYMRRLRQLILPGQVVYDIGANVGFLALWLSQNFCNRGQQIQVVAFEAVPENAAWLRDNLALNPQCNIVSEAYAVGDSDKTITMYSTGRGDGAASTSRSIDGQQQLQESQVPMIALDRYCSGAESRCNPDWLILDVEGFGGEVMRGATKVLERRSPSVSAEIHSEDELKKIEDVLLPLKYQRSVDLSSAWGTHYVWTRCK